MEPTTSTRPATPAAPPAFADTRATPTRDEVEAAIDRLLDHVARNQAEDGSWHGDYGGPMFLLPMYVGIAYAAGIDMSDDKDDIIRYFKNQQNPDGGIGLHYEGHSHVFTSVCGYVALRMLGVPADDRDMTRLRQWFGAHGGPRHSASWGKFFLALMNLYDYRGLNPTPPELWLLPRSLPIHPGRLWCHCRMVYLPMSYLYGKRAKIEENALIADLRRELYDEPYDAIDWAASRDTVADTDSYMEVSALMKTVNKVLLGYEKRPSRRLRNKALAYVLDQIRAEDANTNYICIGPINKLFHTLIWYWEDPNGEHFRGHLERLPDYIWRAEDGTKMQGYENSRLWDTTFMVQAIVATGRTDRVADVLDNAHRYIESNQVLEDVPERETYFRCPSKGGWPFSSREHGWPITDCTAEGIKSSLALEPLVDDPIGEDRLTDAVDLILWWQNPSGGWATYERTRGPAWLEKLNPANCFGDIMIDYDYVECTSACVQAMAAYKARFPGLRDAEIDAATERAVKFLLSIQRDDGSWEGAWAVCFTYGTWFGVNGLRAAGLPADHPAIVRACEFLVAHQQADGGWGETPETCRERRWVHSDGGQAVMTGWALLTLLAGPPRFRDAVVRGVRFLLDRQRDDGSFPEEHIAGMFNKTCAIEYDNYLEIFPLWALAKARAVL